MVLSVATVLTVYGIETSGKLIAILNQKFVATVLTVYGIETATYISVVFAFVLVATVLTVYGIETLTLIDSCPFLLLLQQYLPFTVLKLNRFIN